MTIRKRNPLRAILSTRCRSGSAVTASSGCWGKGGFGLVYLAHDDQLQRTVAIKVPHARLVAQATAAEAYLTEARTVASLDHANIVPVFDVGGTAEFPCFIVSKYVDGSDLAHRLRAKAARLPLAETVELVATVAEALHYAHKQGLVHRDIKPGNILLDKSGKPFVGDFGMALREQDLGHGPRYAGTPSYMRPEQARGEGHRIDIYSLGTVWEWCFTNCLSDGGRSKGIRRASCSIRSPVSKSAHPGSSTIRFPRNGNGSR